MDPRPRDERSRSPSRSNKFERRNHRSRSRSPKRRRNENQAERPLPFNCRGLSRHDLGEYKPMFALYLDIQKQLDIEDLSEAEVKGRWKSFVNKWNRGDLAEGWYDPQTLQRALKADWNDQPAAKTNSIDQPIARSNLESDDEDEYGPSLPESFRLGGTGSSISRTGPGPTIPSASDVLAQREQAAEDATLTRQHAQQDLRHERRLDRKTQLSRLEELAPRATPGTKEAQLEKKRDAATANSSFAASAHETGDVDLRDADVMGDEDSLSDLKRMKQAQERKRSEREIRREEMMRARREEREEKLKGLREKEGRTVDMLKELARERFGAGEG